MMRIMPNIQRLLTRQRLQQALLPLVAGGLALLLYVSTAAPGLTWANDGADGGDLIAATMTWGVPHPSGYPTYCLLARLYALLPLGSIARRFNLFSATMAAASTTLVCLCVRRILRAPTVRTSHEQGPNAWVDSAIALLAALAWATGHTLWSQATITEVYALHSFFCALCLYLALRDDLLIHPRHWALLGLILGLGTGTHLTLLLMVPGLAILLWPNLRAERPGPPTRYDIALALGTLLGLAIYAYLPLAARKDPPINWGVPRTWAGFWWVISGKPYRGYMLGFPLRYLPSRFGAWVRLWSQQYTWLGLALALIGVGGWVEKGQKARAWATILIFAAYTLYAITYDTTDSYIYLIPTYLITALWIAEGARTLYDELYAWRPSQFPKKGPTHIGLLAGLVLLAIPIWSVARHYEALDLSNDYVAIRWADQVLHDLPLGALLITGEDRHTFTLDYALWVEHRRRDLLVIDGELLPYPWYAQQISKRAPALEMDSSPLTLEGLVSANLKQDAIYLSSARPELEQTYEMERQGVLWRILRSRTTGP